MKTPLQSIADQISHAADALRDCQERLSITLRMDGVSKSPPDALAPVHAVLIEVVRCYGYLRTCALKFDMASENLEDQRHVQS